MVTYSTPGEYRKRLSEKFDRHVLEDAERNISGMENILKFIIT